jgi:hypothetical protein
MHARRVLVWVGCTFAVAGVLTRACPGQPLVPGTGIKVLKCSDDFEDPAWEFVPHPPKSSVEMDKQNRPPLGRSRNGLWAECQLRGEPDLVQRVATPLGGLPGSQGALLLRTHLAGIPGRLSGKAEQDDLQMNISQRAGGGIPVSWSPSVVVRVYVPPLDEWEPRSGASFGFRADVFGTRRKEREGLFGPASETVQENYWPGFFFNLEARPARGNEPRAYLSLRATERGGDFRGPELTPGWWTLGMSFTPDGRIHYFAHAGIEDLTADDYLATRSPYGFRCERFNTMFFNVLCREDGRTWSTPWIIDDPTLYAVRGFAEQEASPPQVPSARSSGRRRAR